MTSLRVTASATAMSTGAIASVVASLPVSLRSAATDAASADLVALDGSVGWPERTADAVQHAARGLMVVQPCPVAPDEVPQTSSVPVVIDYRFAGNPAVSSAARVFDGWEADAMVEVSSLVSDPEDTGRLLLDQLATLRRLGLPPVNLDQLTWAFERLLPSRIHAFGCSAPAQRARHLGRAASPQGPGTRSGPRDRAGRSRPEHGATRRLGPHHVRGRNHAPHGLGELSQGGLASPPRCGRRRPPDR